MLIVFFQCTQLTLNFRFFPQEMSAIASIRYLTMSLQNKCSHIVLSAFVMDSAEKRDSCVTCVYSFCLQVGQNL